MTTFLMGACAQQPNTSASQPPEARLSVRDEPLPHPSSSSAPSAASGQSSPSAGAENAEPVTYPTGWLTVPADDVDAGAPVSVLYLPDYDVVPHRAGKPVADDEREALRGAIPATEPGQAAIAFGGRVHCIDADLLLVNLPDVLPDAVYDEVYAYAATSDCAGQGIPGVTGERIPGYAQGRQDDLYLGEAEFAVPCAYRTMLKVQAAAGELEAQGLRLLVYDAYRPMTAQMYLSDAFTAAYGENEVIRNSLGDWSMNWYVADGASGHNFGTDVDVSVCDAQGTPLPMPSAFDAFDDSGHLSDSPVDSGSITPETYCDAVASNDACLALHRAFVNAGFSELASEWWHFGDDEAEAANRSVIGPGGLDFVAFL